MIMRMFYNDVPLRTIDHSIIINHSIIQSFKCVVITMELKHNHMLHRTVLLAEAQVRCGLLTEAQVPVSKAVTNQVL